MSAYMVSRATIDAIVAFAKAHVCHTGGMEEFGAIADRANRRGHIDWLENGALDGIPDDPDSELVAGIAGERPLNIWDVLGRVLWAENRRSVFARYRGDDAVTGGMAMLAEIAGYRAAGHAPPAPVVALKLINHLDYQSCEHGGWEHSLAHRALTGLRETAICALPGYADAPWGMP